MTTRDNIPYGINVIYPVLYVKFIEIPLTKTQIFNRKIEPLIEGFGFAITVTLISLPFWLLVSFLGAQ